MKKYKIRFLEKGMWGVVRTADNILYDIYFYTRKDAQYVIKQWESAE